MLPPFIKQLSLSCSTFGKKSNIMERVVTVKQWGMS